MVVLHSAVIKPRVILQSYLKNYLSIFPQPGVKVIVGSPTYHSGVQDKDGGDSGTTAEINNGCTIISYLAVENVVE